MIKINPLRRMFPKNKAETKLLNLQKRRQNQIRKIAEIESKIAFLIYESRSIITEIAHTENVGDWKTREKINQKLTLSTRKMANATQKSNQETEKLYSIDKLYQEAADALRKTLTPEQLENVFPGLEKD